MKIAPSILAADLSDFGTGLEQCEAGGAELIHFDVMDGHFVPNLSFGPPVLEALVQRTRLAFDVHLMVEAPEELLDLYLEHAAWVSVHWEATRHLDGVLAKIRDAGVRAGVALNPATPVEVLVDVLPQLDFVLLMSVNPGFCAQKLIPYVLDKARRLRSLLEQTGHPEVTIEMDGGIKDHNLDQVKRAGVEVAVVGSGVFAAEDPVAKLTELVRQAAADEPVAASATTSRGS